MKIRDNFSDFRYLGSYDHPNIIKEFVRYDEVKSMSDRMLKWFINNYGPDKGTEMFNDMIKYITPEDK